MRKLTIRLLASSALLSAATLPALAQDVFPPPADDADVVIIDQVVLGDVFANMDVVIVDNAEGASAAATATGNTTTATAHGNDLDFDVVQQQDGAVTATTSLSGGTVYGGTASTTTTAYGNAASSSTDNGTVFSTVTQTSNADVNASSQIDLDGADAVSANTTATANVVSYSSENGTNRGFTTQTGNASVSATTDADICCNNDSVALGSTATGNSVSSYGATTTNFNGAVQTMAAGTQVSAQTTARMDNGNNVAVSATSAGNNTSVENEFGFATLGRDGSDLYQENRASVDADSSVSLTSWSGTSGATSYGVGNSGLISNLGSDTGMYALQNNFGDVSSTAYFDGEYSDGSHGYASATSIGNAATATLCYTCGGDSILYGRTNQTNSGNTIASSHVAHGSGGYVSGAATAVGNSATYQSFNSGGN